MTFAIAKIIFTYFFNKIDLKLDTNDFDLAYTFVILNRCG